MRFFVGILLLLLLGSCIGEPQKQAELVNGTGIVNRYFSRFPDQHFDFLILGEDTEKTKKDLEENGYQIKPNQTNQYRNEDKNVEVILPEMAQMSSFKMFLYSSSDIAAHPNLIEFFTEQSTTKNLSSDFSVFSFETLEQDFSITVFLQPDFIRLNYELKTDH